MVGAGEYIRSSAVVGNVVAADAMMSGGDGQPETLAGVTVTLGGEHAMGETMETDMSGGFAFTGLRAGTYTVTISDFPEDVSFEEVSLEISVEVGEVGQADFTGHFIRTSAVEGQVIIEGEGLAGVTVTLGGGPADESYTRMTDADGMYRFENLRPGDYTVSISDFDTRDYEFASTSQDVSVDLDETGTVSFTGVLLRTSGIAGRVSVEGMGLGGIEVTLSGGEEAQMATTDDGGQYNFAGLAAGDYTVSIAVESDAYVFESMSTDVTVGDDESAIVNFEGMHARTASVSGMVFLDEATKNDMHDEGEHPLAHAGIPVALVGPGVNEQRLGATDATGAFSFSGLRSGPYQLVVLIDATVAAVLAANDVAYGGPATGYEIALGVGEAASQGIPFDITHTTVNFTVMLKHGDDMGAAVSGASVTLYDSAGDDKTKVGSGETGDDGSVAIKVARAGTSGNMVHASVSHEDYSGDGMTAVSWDPQMFATAGSNGHDLVNLSVDATVSGATITTDYGGGDALKGWAMSVMSGDEAVDGAPDKLDDDGNAAFTTTVDADDLPVTYTFAVAGDQDDKLDGGENYDPGSVEYTHDGLALAGTMDAGTMEVQYTTQTLKVYVHHERDQVMGYTGNLLDGDERDGSGDARMVDVSIRYIDGSGRSRAFVSADSIKSGDSKGVHTFSNVPADENVIVQASKATDDAAIKLLDPDELAAYTDMEANGITGGAFGAMGGFNHTVELCPLQATNPQDYGDCASFAYVTTYEVTGTVTKQTVAMDDGDDFEDVEEADTEAGVTVSLSPVDGKNLAGEEESFTTTEKDTRSDKTKGDNPMSAFTFAGVAAGAYTLSVSDGWQANGGNADDMFDPLEETVDLTVRPTTATVYGFIVDDAGFAMDSATVTANNASTMTDQHGRFIIEGIKSETRKKVTGIFVEASVADVGKASVTLDFAANTVKKVEDDNGNDLKLTAAAETASISGTVTASGSGDGIAGVKVEVSYDGTKFEVPENKNAKSKGATKNDIHVTGADGSYTVMVKAQDRGEGVWLRVSKEGMSFVPDVIDDIPAHAGSAVSGFNFTGFVNATISGRVVRPGGGPMSGVTVTATEAGVEDADPTASVTTGRTGSFSLSVPYDRYTIAAAAPETSLTRFSYPDDEQDVRVAPGQNVNFGNITGVSVNARSITTSRVKDETTGNYTGAVNIRWQFDNLATFTTPGHTVETCVEDCGEDDATWTDGSFVADTDADTEDDADEGIRVGTFTAPDSDAGDLGFSVRVSVSSTETLADGTTTEARTGTSAVRAVDRVDASPSKITAVRDTRAGATADSLIVNWEVSTNSRTVTQVVITLDMGAAGTQSLIAAGTAPLALTGGATDATSAVLVVSGFTAADWTIAGSTQTLNVTEADLRKALKVRVQTQQASEVDDDDDPVWKATATVDVAADPASS